VADRRDAHVEPATFEGRMPPHDLGAERAVLCALLVGGIQYLDEVSDILKPEHCYSEAHRLITDACFVLASKGQPIDSVTVGTHLRDAERLSQVGGPSYLADLLLASPDLANVRAHATIVVQRWRARQVILTCHTLAAQGYLAPGLSSGYAAEAAERLHVLAHDNVELGAQRAGVILRDAMRKLYESANSKRSISGTPTKFRRLDRVLAGLHPNELTIIAARPGMGKTSAALQIAINVAEGDVEEGTLPQGVAFFSLEMPREQIVMRATCCDARVDSEKLRTNNWAPLDWQKLTASAQKIAKLPIWFDDKSSIPMLDLRARIRRIQAECARLKHPDGSPVLLGLVVVDYLQLMAGSDDADNREQEIAMISRGLKNLAMELKIPVIALSQLNRGLESRSDKRPQLSDLRESGAIEQDADNVLFIYRDEYYTKGACKVPGLAEIAAAKQRNGPNETVLMRWLERYTRFEDLPDGEGQAYDRGET
jgi:replicative DNA helicase